MIEESENKRTSIVQTYCSFCGVKTPANIDDNRPLCKDCKGDD